jgi:hypothetical protein
MKKLLKISVLTIMALFMVNCSSDDSDGGGGGNVPGNGWKIGSTNYTTTFSMRVDEMNSIVAFDAFPGGDNFNTASVLFNEITGIAAGTYKVVTKPNFEDLLADEIMISASTDYNNETEQYEKIYTAVFDQNVNATVTINGGKVKVVIPELNIITVPINSTSETTTFSGTIIEQ